MSKLNFSDCAFVPDPFFDLDVKEKHFHLNDIARYYHVDVSMYDESKKNDSNRVASKVIQTILTSREYAVKEEYGYIFNEIDVDTFVQL